MNKERQDLLTACMLVIAALLLGVCMVGAVAGLFVGGGWRAVVGAVAVVWVGAIIVTKIARWVLRRGWL